MKKSKFSSPVGIFCMTVLQGSIFFLMISMQIRWNLWGQWMCRVEICFLVFYGNMLCRRLCSSCREFQINWKLDLLLFQGASQFLVQKCRKLLLKLLSPTGETSLLSLLFLNTRFPMAIFSFLPRLVGLAGRKMLSVHSAYMMLEINDFLWCP